MIRTKTKKDTLGRNASPGCKGGKVKPDSQETRELIYKLALLGLTNEEIADCLGIHWDTLNKWFKKNPDLKAIRLQGGTRADANVAMSMYKRAVGFFFDEVEVNEEHIKDTKTGKKTGKVLVRTKTTKKYVIPDVKAQIHWLRNRQRGHWAEAPFTVKGHIKHSHSGNVSHEFKKVEELDIENLSPFAQEVLFEIGKKQLETGQRDN